MSAEGSLEQTFSELLENGDRSRVRGRRSEKVELDVNVLRADDCLLILKDYVQATDRGIVIVDTRRHVLLMNPAARQVLSIDDHDIATLGSAAGDPDIDFAIGGAIHDGRPAWHEKYLPHPDRLLRLHIIPVLRDTGEPRFVVVTIDDVARLRHLETVRRDFVANVSHELRTPITSINLLLETLQNGVDEPEMEAYFLRRIQVETQSMMRLVEELLELSRLESGRLPLVLEAIGVRDIFERVLQRLQAMAEEKEISLTLDVQFGLPPALADGHGLEQVLMNLTHNAIKFTSSGGNVSLRARRQGRAVNIEVADSGPGIDPDEVDRVFERFYKADKGRNRAGGSGLGLAVARHLVELHGGKLRVISESGRGSRFMFSVPVVDETADTAGEREE